MNTPQSRRPESLSRKPMRQERIAAARRRVEEEAKGHLSVLREATMRPPTGETQIKMANDSIKWVRKNHALMDSMSKAEALSSITYLAGFQNYCPVETGLAIRLLCEGNREALDGIIHQFMGKMQSAMRMEERVMLDNMAGSKRYGLLCAALGDVNCIRMVNFWADEALDADMRSGEGRKIHMMVGDVPTRAVKVNMAYGKAVQKLREELDSLRAQVMEWVDGNGSPAQ